MSPVADDEALLSQAAAMATRFDGCATPRSVRPMGRGLINDSFEIIVPGAAFVLQRINPRVFPAPERIMANLLRLQRALRETAAATPPRLPRFIASTQGKLFARDAQGALWRLMELIDNSRALNVLEHPDQAREVGRLLGQFHRFADGLNAADYAVTLPELHRTPTYWQALRTAYRAWRTALDPTAPDAPDIASAYAAIRRRTALIDRIDNLWRAGTLPTRLIHGDPKLDNLLFDQTGARGLCLIDLDTVQPGLRVHDIGDCLRSCCKRQTGSSAAPVVEFDADLADALLASYAQAAGDLLDAAESACLFETIRLIPLELAMRFLADHLQGNRYFRIAEAGDNLRKAHIQLQLVAAIERQATTLRDLIARSFPRARA